MADPVTDGRSAVEARIDEGGTNTRVRSFVGARGQRLAAITGNRSACDDVRYVDPGEQVVAETVAVLVAQRHDVEPDAGAGKGRRERPQHLTVLSRDQIALSGRGTS